MCNELQVAGYKFTERSKDVLHTPYKQKIKRDRMSPIFIEMTNVGGLIYQARKTRVG